MITAFETVGTRPEVSLEARISNVTTTSAHLVTVIDPRNSETHWRLEYAGSEGGPWISAPGAEGVIPKSEAVDELINFPVDLASLHPDSTYFVRLFAENEPETGVHKHATSGVVEFETAGPPVAGTFEAHAISGEAMRALASVNSHGGPLDELQLVRIGGTPTGGTFTLSFGGQTTGPIGFDATSHEVYEALHALPSNAGIGIDAAGPAGGPYTIEFPGEPGVDEPEIVADGSDLTPSGSASVTVTQVGGPGYDTHFHFDYVTEEQFDKSGFTEASSTPEVDLGFGKLVETSGNQAEHTPADISFSTSVVGQDLPGLKPGTTYRYRVVTTNTSPGNPVVEGDEQTLTVPVAAAEQDVTCENQALRSGPSAFLPDCRGYEQITPADKDGAQDIFRYGLIFESTQIGEDGEHVELHAPGTQWEPSPDSAESNYFFSRTPVGWQMASATPQPEAGVDRYLPTVFSSDLTELGLQVQWTTSGESRSANIEFKAGAPGGPYSTAAVVPRGEVPDGGGWVAASVDGRRLVLEVEDHTLLGKATGTTENSDLYEYSSGHLRQVNVLTDGGEISSCGARLASESEAGDPTRRAVSSSGAQILFVDNCTHDLYARIDGIETKDLGPYVFQAENAEGSKLLLEKSNGGTSEFFLSEAGVVRPVFSVQGQATVKISQDFTKIYMASEAQLTSDAPPTDEQTKDIYSYSIANEKLMFLFQAAREDSAVQISVSADGNDLYLKGTKGVAGFTGATGQAIGGIYRYDSTENAISCVTCASSFNPESSLEIKESGVYPSENGDYIFFDTWVPLVPQDVDGQVEPEAITDGHGNFNQHPSPSYSTSSDVYEWRRNGIDDCTQIQGCLSLISSGRGGFKNVLLGISPSGHDVFFATHEALVPQDTDTAGDIYDARIGGGFPPPPARPVECEGDACDSPVAAPVDTTPASFAFSGPGNPTPVVTSKTVKPKPRAKPCKKGMTRVKGRCVKRKPAKKADRRSAKAKRGGKR
ncbi:MAG TPA: hypothetical protein VIJ39_10285 [Solirubrobacteraceae bacterium]